MLVPFYEKNQKRPVDNFLDLFPFFSLNILLYPFFSHCIHEIRLKSEPTDNLTDVGAVFQGLDTEVIHI